MRKYTLLLVILAALAAILAWAGPSSKASLPAGWEYKQLTTVHETLLRPTVDEGGVFDKKANDEVVKGIAMANGIFDKQFQTELASAGHEGWELVSVTSSSSEHENVQTTESTAYLKRPAR